MITPSYRYRAKVLRVIDGDTYWVDIDYGFYEHGIKSIRLHGYSCAELRSTDGVRAKERAQELIMAANSVVVETHKDSKSADVQTFARWVAAVYLDDVHIGELLAADGLAVKS